MLFYCYANVAIRPFQRLFMALFVRKFTFATQFCDGFAVCFCIFSQRRISHCFFFLWLSLQRTRSFAAPSATKNSADGSSEPLRAVPLYDLESYFFALTEPGITQSATSPAKKDMAQRIAGQSKRQDLWRSPASCCFVHRLLCVISAFDKQKKEERLRRAALPQFRLCY